MRQEFSKSNTEVSKRLFQPSMPVTKENRFSYDKSLIALSSSWGSLIADLSMQVGSFYTVIDTLQMAPTITANSDWVHIFGRSDIGSFNIYIPSDTAASFLQLAHNDLNISKLEGADAALIFEHLLTDYIYKLEQILGTNLMIESITDVTTSVTDPLLGFEFFINGKAEKCAISFKGELHNVVEQIVAPHSFPEEKQLNTKMIIHLGPVVLPARQAYLARIGEMINCGVEPSDVIKGVLMRSDGRYWPIHIEDEKIEIVGALAAPVDFTNQDQENIFVTFGLGEAELSAYERSTITIGTMINITRLPNNTANIYYQARPFGQGNLSILGSNLAVTLNSVGAFSA